MKTKLEHFWNYMCPTCKQDVREAPRPGRRNCSQCGQGIGKPSCKRKLKSPEDKIHVVLPRWQWNFVIDRVAEWKHGNSQLLKEIRNQLTRKGGER